MSINHHVTNEKERSKSSKESDKYFLQQCLNGGVEKVIKKEKM